MKNKIIGILKIAFVMLAVLTISSSCTKDKWYENPDSLNSFTETFTVKSTDWKYDSKDQTYYFEFDFPQLTPYISNKGTVTATTIIDGTNRMLSYTFYFVNEDKQQCAETISCEYNNNFIRFNVSALDQFTSTPVSFKPDTYKFKVSLVW